MLVLPMLPRQRSFRGDATSLLECRVVVPGHDGVSVFARARSPCRWRRARSARSWMRSGSSPPRRPPRARGVPPRGRRRRGRRRGVAVIGTRTAAARRRRCRRGFLRACLARGARRRRARVPLRVRRAPRNVRRVGLPRLRAAGLGRRAHGGGRALLGAAAHAAHRARRGSRGRRVHAVWAHGRRRQRAGADRLAAAPLEAGNEREETKGGNERRS